MFILKLLKFLKVLTLQLQNDIIKSYGKEGDFLTLVKRAPLGNRKSLDMTEGSIVKKILLFALPLLAGNLFQQLYNMVDTWVIGQTGNSGAYAAVGSVGPVTNVLIGFFMGLSTGAGVVISQYYGAKDFENLKKAVHTSVAMTLILGVIFTVVGVIMTPTVLRLMLGSAENGSVVYPHAKTYLTIYFAGVLGLMVYNIGAGILRAVGDSQRPFYFLVASALTNIALDLLFVFKLGWGVAGVALATIIAQFVSAILTVITLIRTKECVRLLITDIKIDISSLKKIISIGIPGAVQMALTAFSNIFVQSYISGANGTQEIVLGGWTTYSKIDQFMFLPMQSIAHSVTTFVGQNLGNSNEKRARKGVLTAYLLSTACTLTIMTPVMIFAPQLSTVFNKDPLVVENATMLLHYITPFYLFSCINQTLAAALRGAGNSRAPMMIMLCSFVGFRQLYLFIVSNYISNDLLFIGFAYPAGWMMCAICTLIYYKTCKFKKIV